MKNTINSRLSKILQEYVVPVLQAHSFRAVGGQFEKELGRFAWMLEVQRGRESNRAKVEFTLNCGIFVPGIASLYSNCATPEDRNLPNCCVHVRIGMLANDKLDKWWVLQVHDASSIDEAIGEDLALRVQNHVIPFFSRFQTIDDIFLFLSSPRPASDKYIWPQSHIIALSYAAILAYQLNRVSDLTILLNRAVAESDGSPLEEVVLRLKRRLTEDKL